MRAAVRFTSNPYLHLVSAGLALALAAGIAAPAAWQRAFAQTRRKVVEPVGDDEALRVPRNRRGIRVEVAVDHAGRPAQGVGDLLEQRSAGIRERNEEA